MDHREIVTSLSQAQRDHLTDTSDLPGLPLLGLLDLLREQQVLLR